MTRNCCSVWISEHLPWIVVALLVLWAPPILFNAAVNLHLVSAGSGYPGWRDPVLLLPIVELGLMTAAVPLLLGRRRSGWLMVVWALVATAAQTAWTVLVIGRLEGLRATLGRAATVEAVAGVVVGAMLLAMVRPYYSRNPAAFGR